MMKSPATALAVLLLTAPAWADEPYDWTGFYVGAHAGYGWGDAEQRQTTGGMPPGPFDYSAEGALGGGTIGYNLQVGNFVVGLEGDLGYMDLSGAGRIDSSVPTKWQDITLDSGLYGVAAGRVGFAFGRALIYGKGGFAYYDGEAWQQTTNPGFVTHGTDAFTGWAYGGGLEHALGNGWSLKAEYLHFAFDTEGGDQTSVTDDPIGYVYENTTDVSADTVKLGVQYRFGASADGYLK